jgi:uncharacterized membrane protein YhhN
MLVPYLLVLFLINYAGPKDKLFVFPIIGLFGSFAGDFLLNLEGSQFFLWGMLGFMVTHICNGLYFNNLKKVAILKSKNALIALLFLTVASAGTIIIIKDNVGEFLIPIIIYMVLISVMAILASTLSDSKRYNNSAVHYFIPGAILFVLSDGLLAINKFNLQDSLLDVFVMLTYGLAQLYLVMGFYKTVPKSKK